MAVLDGGKMMLPFLKEGFILILLDLQKTTLTNMSFRF